MIGLCNCPLRMLHGASSVKFLKIRIFRNQSKYSKYLPGVYFHFFLNTNSLYKKLHNIQLTGVYT